MTRSEFYKLKIGHRVMFNSVDADTGTVVAVTGSGLKRVVQVHWDADSAIGGLGDFVVEDAALLDWVT